MYVAIKAVKNLETMKRNKNSGLSATAAKINEANDRIIWKTDAFEISLKFAFESEKLLPRVPQIPFFSSIEIG